MSTPHAQQLLLAYSWRWARFAASRRAGSVYDVLRLYPDGSVWFWSPVSQVSARDHAGTYQLALAGHDLVDARDLAERLADLPTFEGRQARDAPIVQVVAGVGGKSQAHLLSQQAGTPLPPEWREAISLGGNLRTRAEQSPLAAVQLSWEPAVEGLVSGQPGSLFLSFKNIGSRPVRLTIDPNSLSFHAKGAEGRVDERSASAPHVERPTLGLQDEADYLLGGLTAPAEIQPGHAARAFFMSVYSPPGSGMLELSVSIGGSIDLIYPAGSPLDRGRNRPAVPFRVQSDLMPVQVL
jgi:hypothetical protein